MTQSGAEGRSADTLLSLAEVAQMWRVTEEVIRRMAVRGELPFRVVGESSMRIPRSAVDAFMRGEPIALDDRFLAKLDRMLDALDGIDRGIKSLVEYNARRSGKRAGIKPEIREAIIKRDGLVCRYCGKRVTRDTLVLDHIRSIALGGRTHPDNLVVCCISCNRRKGQYTLEEVGMTLRDPDPESIDRLSRILAVARADPRVVALAEARAHMDSPSQTEEASHGAHGPASGVESCAKAGQTGAAASGIQRASHPQVP